MQREELVIEPKIQNTGYLQLLEISNLLPF